MHASLISEARPSSHSTGTTQDLLYSKMSTVRKYAGLPDLVSADQSEKLEAKTDLNRILLPISTKLLNSQTTIQHIS